MTSEQNNSEISKKISVPPDSPWFSGHFPGEPVLPGIAQLQMVSEAIRESAGEDLKITGVKRVRFKQIIRPGDPMGISIRKDKNDNYIFKITVNDEVSCSGIMAVEKSQMKENNDSGNG